LLSPLRGAIVEVRLSFALLRP